MRANPDRSNQPTTHQSPAHTLTHKNAQRQIPRMQSRICNKTCARIDRRYLSLCRARGFPLGWGVRADFLIDRRREHVWCWCGWLCDLASGNVLQVPKLNYPSAVQRCDRCVTPARPCIVTTNIYARRTTHVARPTSRSTPHITWARGDRRQRRRRRRRSQNPPKCKRALSLFLNSVQPKNGTASWQYLSYIKKSNTAHTNYTHTRAQAQYVYMYHGLLQIRYSRKSIPAIIYICTHSRARVSAHVIVYLCLDIYYILLLKSQCCLTHSNWARLPDRIHQNRDWSLCEYAA